MDDRRGAQRVVIPKPVPATFGGFEVTMIEISLIGCSVEHTDRIAPKSKLPLKFKWRGSEVRLEATVIRSEMRPVGRRVLQDAGGIARRHQGDRRLADETGRAERSARCRATAAART